MSLDTMERRAAPPAAPQTCPQCLSNGPFYESQARQGAWCIACFRSRNRIHVAAVRAHQLNNAPQPILATIRAKAPEDRTRGEQLALLRAACPPGRKVCCWCWGEQPKGHFQVNRKNRDGRDHYCQTCQQIRARLAQYARQQKEQAVCP